MEMPRRSNVPEGLETHDSEIELYACVPPFGPLHRPNIHGIHVTIGLSEMEGGLVYG